MPFDLVIRGGHVVTPDGVMRHDLAIENERIVEAEPEITGSAHETIHVDNLHILPGMIDPHVHFNEAGGTARTDWEGVRSGSTALALGGGTAFFDMPLNSDPPTLDGRSFDQKRAACEASSLTDFALWGGLTPANLDRLEELADRGVIGFKAFMSNSGMPDFPACDDLSLLRGMKIAARLGLPVAVHAESETLTSALSLEAKSENRKSIADYLASRPIVAEVDAIRRAIAFAQETECPLHIVHISSTAGSMEVVEAKHLWKKDKSGPLDITGETCPHYLLLNENDLHQLGARAKCAPPLRNDQEVTAMVAQLLAGGFDFVASDHSPAPPHMKTSQNFFEVWGGISGVQSTLHALLTLKVPLPQIARLIAGQVARRFGIPHKGFIEIGNDADLVLVDLSRESILTQDQLADRHKLSPYVGRKFRGRIARTILRGRTIVLDGKPLGNSTGRLLRPSR